MFWRIVNILAAIAAIVFLFTVLAYADDRTAASASVGSFSIAATMRVHVAQLSDAMLLLSTSPGANRDEARRIVGAMLGQLGPTEAR